MPPFTCGSQSCPDLWFWDSRREGDKRIVLLLLDMLLSPTFLWSWSPIAFISVCPPLALPEFRLFPSILWLYLHQCVENLPPFLCTQLPKEVVIYSDRILQRNPSDLPIILRMKSSVSWACGIVQASTVWPFPHHPCYILAPRLFHSLHFLPPPPAMPFLHFLPGEPYSTSRFYYYRTRLENRDLLGAWLQCISSDSYNYLYPCWFSLLDRD